MISEVIKEYKKKLKYYKEGYWKFYHTNDITTIIRQFILLNEQLIKYNIKDCRNKWNHYETSKTKCKKRATLEDKVCSKEGLPGKYRNTSYNKVKR